MTTQPEALRLADVIANDPCSKAHHDAAAAELRRLHQHEVALNTWLEKTEWVQETARPKELGMHRADAMRRRVEQAEAQRDALMEALKELTGHINERFSGGVWDRARAAIKAVEENT